MASCFRHGIVFEGGDDVLLTDSMWKVTLQYNLSEVQEESQKLSSLLVEVKDQFNTFFHRLLHANVSASSPIYKLEVGFRYEYVLLQQSVHEYLGEVKDLVTLLPKTRRRRGLLDTGGHALRFLFGTLDSSDLEVIDNRLNYLYDTTEEIVHQTKDQLTVLANMQTEVAAHSKTINKVITNLKEYHSVMHKALSKVFSRENATQTQIDNILSYLKLSSALTDTKDTVISAIQKQNRFHQAIEDLAKGSLTSNLLSPHEYLKVLKSVEKVLPSPTKMFAPVDLENIHKYFSVAKVYSYTTIHTMRVVIQLPLKVDDRVFQVFDLVSFPVYNPVLSKWIQWDIEKDQKLVMSKDRLTYSLYEKNSFDRECLKGPLVVCPVTNVMWSVHKQPSCIVDLFLGKLTDSCERKVLSSLTSPILLKTCSRWIYSTSETHSVTLNCYDDRGNLNVTSLKLSGTGELSEVSTCDVIGAAFRLPARIHGSNTVKGAVAKVLVPDLSEMFTAEESELLHDDVNVTLEVLERLESELSTLGVQEYHLDGVFGRLKAQRYFTTKYKTILMASGGCTVTLVALMLLWFGYRQRGWMTRWCQSRRSRRRERRSATFTNLMREMTRAIDKEGPITPETGGEPLAVSAVTEEAQGVPTPAVRS